MNKLTKGMYIRVRLAGSEDDWCHGQVILASPNGESVFVFLLGGIVRTEHGWIGGGLPLVIDYEARTVFSLFGDEYDELVHVVIIPRYGTANSCSRNPSESGFPINTTRAGGQVAWPSEKGRCRNERVKI